jgi:glycosyltransferase involved in cell wall biosynthesis
VPIFCADIAPFREIASDDALRFALDESPAAVAERIAAALRRDSRYRLRRRVRAQYTWQAIYRRSIAPLLADPSGRAGA